jgi:hypothetical protein
MLFVSLPLHRLRRAGAAMLAAGSLVVLNGVLSLTSFGPVASAACSTPATTLGQATYTVSVTSAANYFAWIHLKAPDTTNNSAYLKADAGCSWLMGDSSTIPANTWTWINYADGTKSTLAAFNLTAGSHTLTLSGHEPGVSVDRILLSSDANCVPTGDGSNCTTVVATPVPGTQTSTPVPASPTPTPVVGTTGGNNPTPPPTVVVTSTTPTPAVSGTVKLVPSAQSSGNVTVKVDGTPVSSNGNLDTTYLTNGVHTVTVEDNTTKESVTAQVEVKNDLTLWQTMRNVVFSSLHGNKALINGILITLGVLLLMVLAFFITRMLWHRRPQPIHSNI